MAQPRPATTHGRHRALTAPEQHRRRVEAHTRIPEDVRAALQRAVEALPDRFDPLGWSFTGSGLLGWVARRDSLPSHSVLAISPDCRTAWVHPGDEVEDVLADLSQSSPLGRGQIEFLLNQETRFGRGPWRLTPVGDLGWLCTRAARLAGRRHFLVTRDGQVEAVGPLSLSEAEDALTVRVLGLRYTE